MDTADPQRGHPRGGLSEQRRAGIKHRRASAASAGLRYVTDDQGGITRKRVGSGWAYFLPDGPRITDRRERKRINSLAIPPAWTQVWICPDPDGHIQATARDARGRKQYRYHPAYRDARDHSKFRHMLEFSEVLPLLRDRIEHDLRAPDHSRRQLLATVVRLLDRTLIRVGNDEYARENKSFGLTTLRRRHVRVNGESLSFTFRGKSGVEHSIMLEEPRLARIIQRCQDLPGHELFQYLDANAQAPGDFLGRRERVPARAHRARRHGQGFPHLGRHHARGGGAARDGAGARAGARPTATSCAPSTRSPSAWATPAPCAASTTSTRSSCAPT